MKKLQRSRLLNDDPLAVSHSEVRVLAF